MASILDLPPSAIALIGSFLDDDKNRNACMVAAKCFGAVHELEETHMFMLSFHADIDNVRHSIDHVVKLKPRLRSVTIIFEHLDYTWDYQGVIRFRERVRELAAMPLLKLELDFTDCDLSFIHTIAWDCSACNVYVIISFSTFNLINVILAMKQLHSLECTPETFIHMQNDAAILDRIKNITILIPSHSTSIDLRCVNPLNTNIILKKDVLHCNVEGVDKVSKLISQPSYDMEHEEYENGITPLLASLRLHESPALQSVSIETLSDETLRMWMDIADALSDSTSYVIDVRGDATCLRLLDHLRQRGVKHVNVKLLVHHQFDALVARLLQLVTRVEYPLEIRHVHLTCKLNSIAEVYARMRPADREAWHFAKYM